MNWAEFFSMGGYALYVWGSYGMVLVMFVIEIAMVLHRRNVTLQQLRLLRDAKDEE